MTVTIFGQPQLDRLVSDALKEASPDDTYAVVAHVDETGTRIVAGFTRPIGKSRWKLAGVFEHDWNGDNKVGGEFIWSGK